MKTGTLDALVERTTISFPRAIKSEEISNILSYVAAKLSNCSINYNVERHHHIRAEGGVSTEDTHGSSKASGMISVYSPAALAQAIFDLTGLFVGTAPLDDPEKLRYMFTGLKFSTVSGYDLEELEESRPGELRLIDDVRKHVGAYFAEHQKSSS